MDEAGSNYLNYVKPVVESTQPICWRDLESIVSERYYLTLQQLGDAVFWGIDNDTLHVENFMFVI